MSKRSKFVVITAGDANGRRLSHVLTRAGINYSLLTVAHAVPKRGKQTLAGFWKARLRAHVAANPWLRSLQHRNRPAYAQAPTYVGFCNGALMKARLREAAPDYIIMMGGGIIDAETIGLARLGVFNVHPGLLPWIRGVDVIRHAVDRGVPIGVTAHFIDVGIDTGDIIDRVIMTVSADDTYETIAERADQLSVAFMADLVVRAWAGETPPRHAQTEKHKLCRTMDAADALAIDRRIAAGEALRLSTTEPYASQIRRDDALFENYERLWPTTERF